MSFDDHLMQEAAPANLAERLPRGRLMPRTCTICGHDKRSRAIEKGILSGEALRAIVVHWSVSPQAYMTWGRYGILLVAVVESASPLVVACRRVKN